MWWSILVVILIPIHCKNTIEEQQKTHIIIKKSFNDWRLWITTCRQGGLWHSYELPLKKQWLLKPRYLVELWILKFGFTVEQWLKKSGFWLLAVRHCCIASLWNHHHTNPPPPSILNKFGCMPGLILLSTNLSYIAGSVLLEHVQESKSHSQIFILQSVHLLPMYLQDGHNQQDTVLGPFIFLVYINDIRISGLQQTSTGNQWQHNLQNNMPTNWHAF